MAKTRLRSWDAAKHLETEGDMVAYLEAALEEGDAALIAAALGDIARARGMTRIAEASGLGQESLDKALTAEGNPELATVLKVVRALGLQLHATPVQGRRRGDEEPASDPELEEVWGACNDLPKMGSLAEVEKDVGQGHGSGPVTGPSQLVVSCDGAGRGPWRLKAILDPTGHAITSSFLAIRPQERELPLPYLWAILNSPLANAYCFAHSTTRHNPKRTVRAIPVPRASPFDLRSVSRTAQEYLDSAGVEPNPPDPVRLRRLLLALDAEVLRLYDLPPRLEREVLDLFAGHQRPGVPFTFDRYFPPDFEPWIPLHHYLSEDFQRSTAGALRRPEKPAPEPVVEALRFAADAFED